MTAGPSPATTSGASVEQQVVDARVRDERAQERRAALAQDGAHAATSPEVGEHRGRRRAAGGEAVDRDLRRAPVDRRRLGLGVDLDARAGLVEQRHLDGHVAAAGDRRDDRLGVEAARDAPLALVVVEQVGVALGAQRPGADEDRVDGGAKLAQQRPVGRVAEPGRGAPDRRAAVGGGDHRGGHARASFDGTLGQSEAGDDRLGRPLAGDRLEVQQRRGHPPQYAEPLSGS